MGSLINSQKKDFFEKTGSKSDSCFEGFPCFIPTILVLFCSILIAPPLKVIAHGFNVKMELQNSTATPSHAFSRDRPLIPKPQLERESTHICNDHFSRKKCVRNVLSTKKMVRSVKRYKVGWHINIRSITPCKGSHQNEHSPKKILSN